MSGLAAQDSAVKQRDLRLESIEALKTPPVVPRGYAVVIGVSNYKNLSPAQNLLFAEKDAKISIRALISKEAGNMGFENVKKLIGPSATLQNIREALEVWLPAHAQEADRAGRLLRRPWHDATSRAAATWRPTTSTSSTSLKPATPCSVWATWYRKSVKARWKILIMDACHSGKVSVDTSAIV
ncbi:MAG: hypothetical protein WDO73_29940 [Ignavibacteriota bacterium]